MKEKKKVELRELINRLSINDLRTLVFEHSQVDPSFYVELTAQYGKLDASAELALTKKKIKRLFDDSDAIQFISGPEVPKFVKAFTSILNQYQVRLRQGYYRHALDGLLAVFYATAILQNLTYLEVSVEKLFTQILNALNDFSQQVSKQTTTKRTSYVKKVEKMVEKANFADDDGERYDALVSILPMMTEKRCSNH